MFERVNEMRRNVYAALYVLVLVAIIVILDVLFLRHLFWERLISNVGIVLVFLAVYFRFLRGRWAKFRPRRSIT
jgi:hypothetical protein